MEKSLWGKSSIFDFGKCRLFKENNDLRQSLSQLIHILQMYLYYKQKNPHLISVLWVLFVFHALLKESPAIWNTFCLEATPQVLATGTDEKIQVSWEVSDSISGNTSSNKGAKIFTMISLLQMISSKLVTLGKEENYLLWLTFHKKIFQHYQITDLLIMY